MTAEELKKEIIAEAKAAGLEIVEESVEKILVVLEKVVSKYIASSESKMDDIALPFLPMVFGLLKAQAEKIDGKIEPEAAKA